MNYKVNNNKNKIFEQVFYFLDFLGTYSNSLNIIKQYT